ncbi:MAG: TetR/AcrR family transcriptional regulator [Solirubrobacterales bacterium]
MSDPLLQRAFGTQDAPEPDQTTDRILESALGQFEDFGLRRATIEDVARRASVSRITIYRRFPRKELLIEAVILRELRSFLAQLDAAVARYENTDDRLVEGFVFTLNFLRGHTLLNRLLKTEPESLVPYLTVEAGPILAAAREFLTARIGEEVCAERPPPLSLEVAGELLARLVLSFLLTPDSVARLETTDDARQFALRHLAPLLHLSSATTK